MFYSSMRSLNPCCSLLVTHSLLNSSMSSTRSSPCGVSACPSPCGWTGSGDGGLPTHSNACKGPFQTHTGSHGSLGTGSRPSCVKKKRRWRGTLRIVILCLILIMRSHLRSTGHLNAGHTILEAIRPQAWDILIAHFHLTALKVHTFIQADLVVLGVLKEEHTSFFTVSMLFVCFWITLEKEQR